MKNKQIVDEVVNAVTLDVTAVTLISKERKRQLRDVGMEVARRKDEQLRKILTQIHEDCPRSKARHWLTLLNNDAL